MAKLKKKMKDVTGDGKFTFADVLKMRGVKPKGKKSMNGGGRVNDLLFELASQGRLEAPRYMRTRGPRLVRGPMSEETRDSIVRFGSGRGLDSAIQVPFMVYKDGDSDRFEFMSPQDQAEMRRMGVEMGANIEDFADASYRQSHSGPLVDESDPRAVTKVFNTGFGPEAAARITYIDNDKGKELKVKSQGYGGKVKMLKGGKVEYGLGGAVLAGINAIKNKEGLMGGIKNVAKAYATPGSGIAQGAKLAGGMLANSNNPALAGIGKVAGMASNFMPGGAGVAGLAGNVMQNMGGGSGIASVMQPLQGLFQQKHGGYVSSKHRLLRG